MDDAKVYEKEEWYVVMAFTDAGLRYLQPWGVFGTDARNARKWPDEQGATRAAARVLTEKRMSAMAKKLTIEWSVNNIREIKPEETE